MIEEPRSKIACGLKLCTNGSLNIKLFCGFLMVICSPNFMSNVTLIDRPSMQIEIFCYYDWISFPSICRHVWYILNSDHRGEIFLLNIGLPFNPLKMAQFIKLTGGLLIIIEMCSSQIETCVSTILRLRSYVIQSKWACFPLLE